MIPKIYIADTTPSNQHGSGVRRRTTRFACLVTALIGLWLLTAPVAPQSTSATHTVTVVVPEKHDLILTGGDITIVLNGKPDGSDPDPVSDNSCGLMWASNRNNQKRITVQSDLVNPVYTLTVEAVNVQGQGTIGAAAGPVTLENGTAYSLVTGIRRCLGQCDLMYTASATAADPPGIEVHTVTYTFTR